MAVLAVSILALIFTMFTQIGTTDQAVAGPCENLKSTIDLEHAAEMDAAAGTTDEYGPVVTTDLDALAAEALPVYTGALFDDDDNAEMDDLTEAEASLDCFAGFTSRNFRKNLMNLTGKSTAQVQGFDAHHVFPQKFQARFTKAGINIHHPKYGAWWKSRPHQATAYEYNKKWENFFAKYPNPSKSRTLTYGRALNASYSLRGWF